MKIFARWEFRKFFPEGKGDSGFYVTGLGIGERYRLGMVERPWGTRDFLLIFFRETGEGVLFEPNAAQRYGRSAGEWEHCWLMCGGTGMRELLVRNGITPGTPYPADYEGIRPVFRQLRREISSGNPDGIILRNCFENLLREFRRKDRNQDLPIPLRIRKTIPVLESEKKTFSLESLAKTSGLSVSRYAEEFRKYCNCTPIQFHLRHKLRIAEILLRNRALSLAEIAERLDFRNQFYFSTLFKRKMGLSPSAYRKKIGSSD